MYQPRALIIGETPVTVSLAYALSTPPWNLTICNINDTKNLSPHWSIRLDSRKTEIVVSQVIDEIWKAKGTYDVIIFTEKFFLTFAPMSSKFQVLLNPNTIIIVDCTETPWIFDKTNSMFPGNTVLGVYTDINCRRLTSNPNMFLFLDIGESIVQPFGELSYIKNSVNHTDRASFVMSLIEHVCLSRAITFVNAWDNNRNFLKKMAWKNVIAAVCYQALSIIFEETDSIQLANIARAVPFIRGCYQEVLSICWKLKLNFPKPYSPASWNYLKYVVLSEQNNRLKTISKLRFNINHLDANKGFYDFSNGFNVSVLDTLTSLNNLSVSLAIESTYLKHTHSLLRNMVTNRNQQLSSVGPTHTMLRFETVVGIPPDLNMMNFPPFNPLPKPTPPTQIVTKPLIMMVTESKFSYQPENTTNKTHSDDASIVSVDPAIKELVQGYGMAGETYTNVLPQKANTIDPVVRPPPPVHNSPVQLPTPYPYPSPYPSAHYQGNEPSAGQPSFYGPPPMAHTPTFTHAGTTRDLNGYYGQHQPVGPYTILKKTPAFHHLQPSLNRRTPVQQLRQSHQNVMDAINVNGSFDNSPSRYGKYDTTTALIHSANNSRGSKASSVNEAKK